MSRAWTHPGTAWLFPVCALSTEDEKEEGERPSVRFGFIQLPTPWVGEMKKKGTLP